jgi:hypothetical protein
LILLKKHLIEMLCCKSVGLLVITGCIDESTEV